MSLVHFVLRFTKMSSGVGGAIWQNISGIRSASATSFTLLDICL